MCQVSDKLKLCTCKTKDAALLKNYWLLKRHNGENEHVVGSVMIPINIGADMEKMNEKTILGSLNSGNCFDIELKLRENDILELHISIKPDPVKHLILPVHENFITYAFKFNKGRWKTTEYDPFGVNLDTLQQGKIRNALVRKNGAKR